MMAIDDRRRRFAMLDTDNQWSFYFEIVGLDGGERGYETRENVWPSN